ncbi:hypothetical protein NDU88_002959 [Pleurodeles waltl]|uniref:Uncharacterized protein n=1 Tax=Pleurodeles waltl TaxID=8319 RepID=A0AAV7WRE7_PLEWA|nr:hypothetical protein NDU88_002959 [Pleurodeles waltl]
MSGPFPCPSTCRLRARCHRAVSLPERCRSSGLLRVSTVSTGLGARGALAFVAADHGNRRWTIRRGYMQFRVA